MMHPSELIQSHLPLLLSFLLFYVVLPPFGKPFVPISCCWLSLDLLVLLVMVCGVKNQLLWFPSDPTSVLVLISHFVVVLLLAAS